MTFADVDVHFSVLTLRREANPKSVHEHDV